MAEQLPTVPPTEQYTGHSKNTTPPNTHRLHQCSHQCNCTSQFSSPGVQTFCTQKADSDNLWYQHVLRAGSSKPERDKWEYNSTQKGRDCVCVYGDYSTVVPTSHATSFCGLSEVCNIHCAAAVLLWLTVRERKMRAKNCNICCLGTQYIPADWGIVPLCDGMQRCTRWTAHFTLKPRQEGHYHIHTEHCTLPMD